MLLEAARLLKAREDELPGTVRLMFQPAEETEGVRGSITVYLNEKASALSATPDEATPGEATSKEATPATAGQAE